MNLGDPDLNPKNLIQENHVPCLLDLTLENLLGEHINPLTKIQILEIGILDQQKITVTRSTIDHSSKESLQTIDSGLTGAHTILTIKEMMTETLAKEVNSLVQQELLAQEISEADIGRITTIGEAVAGMPL